LTKDHSQLPDLDSSGTSKYKELEADNEESFEYINTIIPKSKEEREKVIKSIDFHQLFKRTEVVILIRIAQALPISVDLVKKEYYLYI
jgi:hypothetical protein